MIQRVSNMFLDFSFERNKRVLPLIVSFWLKWEIMKILLYSKSVPLYYGHTVKRSHKNLMRILIYSKSVPVFPGTKADLKKTLTFFSTRRREKSWRRRKWRWGWRWRMCFNNQQQIFTFPLQFRAVGLWYGLWGNVTLFISHSLLL